jgi:hypothetical protein
MLKFGIVKLGQKLDDIKDIAGQATWKRDVGEGFEF